MNSEKTGPIAMHVVQVPDAEFSVEEVETVRKFVCGAHALPFDFQGVGRC